MTAFDLQSWFDRHLGDQPSVLLGAAGFPGGERSVFGHSPSRILSLAPGQADALNEALESTRGGNGGWIGYLSYEFGLPFVHEAQLLASPREETAGVFRYYDRLDLLPSERVVRPAGRTRPQLKLTPTVADDEHADRIRSLKERLRAGDVYEANLTRTFAGAPCDPSELFLDLAAHAPAPYAAYLEAPQGALVCNSPEGFLRLDPSGQVRTFPIKGTRPRSDDPVLDGVFREQLAADPKERAEHLMVVDLLRNDLGSICSPGSITCGPLFELVAYPGVWHMVTEVRGQLPAGMTRAQLLAATLPAGSITGAPKRAAVQQIHRLERAARGAYCGVVVLATDDGALIANVMIRTAVCSPERTLVQTGGGIVLGSDPGLECAETWLKLSNFVGKS